MQTQGLLFIPDISGFSRFVNETEIEHSRMIIQELLEILINSNQLGLEVSEIEGDAILFYKFGEPPALDDLYKQVENTFCNFHRSIIAYEYRRFCQCDACKSAINLTLKVVTHYGEFTGYNVKTFSKLIGKDVIVAHQLLKNDIEQHEYWLITKDLLKDYPSAGLPQWMKWDNSSKQTDSGEIPFQYTQLGRLKKEIKPEELPQPDLSKKAKMITASKEYDSGIIALFHAAGDYTYRSRWQEGVKAVEELNHILPRLGMRSRCIFENGQAVIFASSYSYQPERIEFSEINETDNSMTNFTLEKTGNNRTKLTVDYYINKGLFATTIFNLGKKKKMEADLRKSLENLEGVVKEVKLLSEKYSF